MPATSATTSKEKTTRMTVARMRESLNTMSRHFRYDRSIRDSYDKEFKYIQADVRLLNFAMDEVGLISDCHMLYAVSMMGVADLESIGLFLNAMSNKNKELSIPKSLDGPSLRVRLAKLINAGFLFKHMYDVRQEDDEGRAINGKVSFYSVPKSAQSFMNNKLLKRIYINEWLQAKPLYELIGWCACGYAAGRVSRNNFFMEQKQGVFNTKAVGDASIPDVLKMGTTSGNHAYVGFIPAFLHRDTAFQTEKDFEHVCEYTVQLISQFLYFNDRKQRYVRIVVVVEDNPDLVTIARWIHSRGTLEEDYDRIYFTGEGLLRKTKDDSLPGCFLQMKKTSTKEGFGFIAATPDFLDKKS